MRLFLLLIFRLTEVSVGFGTIAKVVSLAGCPGIKGPIPPPVSMSFHQCSHARSVVSIGEIPIR